MTQSITVNAPKRRFTIAEYYRLGQVGILQQDDRVELIHGEIIQMSPIGPKHAGNLDRIARLLTFLFEEHAILRRHNPIRLTDDSEPEPDIAVLKPRVDFYTKSHPEAKDTLLIIELSDSSLSYDQEVKLPLYAAAGIPEYWIVDLQKEQIIVYAGANLGETSIFIKGDVIESSMLPKSISVKSILG